LTEWIGVAICGWSRSLLGGSRGGDHPLFLPEMSIRSRLRFLRWGNRISLRAWPAAILLRAKLAANAVIFPPSPALGFCYFGVFFVPL